tara:strand:- start:6172 stop:6612 length:441 start_codon:yes stop_codon:yes gene_type:complete
MRIVILPITFDEVNKYKEQAEAEGVIYGKKLKWFGIYMTKNHTIDKMLGFGALAFKKDYAIHKCDFIFPQERGNGYHTKLTEFKNELCFNSSNPVVHIEANCTPAAVKTHLNLGAKIVKKFKNGVTQIKYENKSSKKRNRGNKGQD